jgi:hypothetical protein
MASREAISGTPPRRCTLASSRATEDEMAHAKDKGAKNVKKKAAKGIKEKRAEKKLKHDGRRQTGAVETIGERN